MYTLNKVVADYYNIIITYERKWLDLFSTYYYKSKFQLHIPGFILAILTCARQRKKLNLPIEFQIQYSQNFILKYTEVELALNINQLTKFFFHFKLFICPLDIKRPKCFRTFTIWTHDAATKPLRSLQHLETPTCILEHSKTQSLFKNGH